MICREYQRYMDLAIPPTSPEDCHGIPAIKLSRAHAIWPAPQAPAGVQDGVSQQRAQALRPRRPQLLVEDIP
jgi:hypothetical protein